MTKAQLFHNIADELGCDPELVGVVAQELKLRKRDDIIAAVRTRLSEASATGSIDEPGPEAETAETTEPKAKKPAKPGLTLSQRRALLRLLDADETGGVTPQTGFKALPYVYLTEVGYAVDTDGTYTLTGVGRDRAESVNPWYRDWSAGETVAGDESRPVAGTYRAKRAEERRAEALAKEAEEAVKVEDEDDEPTEPVEDHDETATPEAIAA